MEGAVVPSAGKVNFLSFRMPFLEVKASIEDNWRSPVATIHMWAKLMCTKRFVFSADTMELAYEISVPPTDGSSILISRERWQIRILTKFSNIKAFLERE